MEKLAIVGIFYDGYYDIWEDFLELFSINWKNCPYSLYIVNNEKDLNFEKTYNVRVIHAGRDAEYSRKIQVALENIESEYYLLLLEDFFIGFNANTDSINQIIKLLEGKNGKYYRMQISDFDPLGKNKNIKRPLSRRDEYTVTCQPSIWKRDFLAECIGKENYNAWIFEGIYCYSKKAHSEKFLNGCFVDYSNPLNIRHGAVQGKMLPSVCKYFNEHDYIFKNKREILSDRKYNKHVRKQKIKLFLPKGIQKIIRKFISTDSVVEKYKTEILAIMEKMEID